jgi:hypothetical protein
MKIRITLAYGRIECAACSEGFPPLPFLSQADTFLNAFLYLFPQTALRLHGEDAT